MTGLIPFAVLATTVNALRGATLVGDLVIEAPLDEIEDVLTKHEGRPLITVMVGQDEGTVAHGARDFMRADREIELSIQVFLPESVTVEVDGAEVTLDTRGKGIEVVLATIGRQIHRALLLSEAPWSRLWREFVYTTSKFTAQTYLLLLKNTRIAAREIEFTVGTCYEPAFGAPQNHWADLIAMLRSAEEYGDAVANLIAREIQGEEGLTSWRSIQASLGLTRQAAFAIGLAPYEGGEDPATGEAPLEVEITLDDDQRSVTRTIHDGAREPYEAPPPPEPAP